MYKRDSGTSNKTALLYRDTSFVMRLVTTRQLIESACTNTDTNKRYALCSLALVFSCLIDAMPTIIYFVTDDRTPASCDGGNATPTLKASPPWLSCANLSNHVRLKYKNQVKAHNSRRIFYRKKFYRMRNAIDCSFPVSSARHRSRNRMPPEDQCRCLRGPSLCRLQANRPTISTHHQ
jgi:hypothetical protein